MFSHFSVSLFPLLHFYCSTSIHHLFCVSQHLFLKYYFLIHSLVSFYCFIVFSRVCFYNLVFFVAVVGTPTPLSYSSFIGVIFLFFSIYVASLSCVSASCSSLTVVHNACIPILLRHTFMLSTSRRLYELNI